MYYYSVEPNFRDDFNYPSLNRRDLMSLDTINDKDFPKKKINQINSKRNWSINLYNHDIDKSYPKKTDVYINKVDFINKIDDIEKARPTKEKLLIKPNYILNVRDIEKAYPKKDRHFHGKNYFNKNNENKILTPQYQSPNNYNNINIYNNKINNNKNYKQQSSNNLNFNNHLKNSYNFNNRYFNNGNYNNNFDDYKYNREANKNNSVKNSNVYNRYNNNDKYNNNRLSNSTKNILTIPLDTRHIIQNQKDYKDTIHDAFNNYPDYINKPKPDNYILNHHHDLVIGIPNKNNRLDIMLDKSNKLLSYDFSQKINFNDNNSKGKKFDFMNNPDSVRINRTIPLEIKNQGLEYLYKELDTYKPNSYEQHLDLFTQNY